MMPLVSLVSALHSTPAAAWESASTTGKTADGTVEISGIDGRALHEHGGEAADIGSARFRVENLRSEPVVVTVRRVEFLTGHDCDAVPSTVRSEPKLGGVFYDGLRESVSSVSVPKGPLEVQVGFERVGAYYTYCDRFAFRVHFDVGGEAVVAVAETNVTRMEPSREP